MRLGKLCHRVVWTLPNLFKRTNGRMHCPTPYGRLDKTFLMVKHPSYSDMSGVVVLWQTRKMTKKQKPQCNTVLTVDSVCITERTHTKVCTASSLCLFFSPSCPSEECAWVLLLWMCVVCASQVSKSIQIYLILFSWLSTLSFSWIGLFCRFKIYCTCVWERDPSIVALLKASYNFSPFWEEFFLIWIKDLRIEIDLIYCMTLKTLETNLTSVGLYKYNWLVTHLPLRRNQLVVQPPSWPDWRPGLSSPYTCWPLTALYRKLSLSSCCWYAPLPTTHTRTHTHPHTQFHSIKIRLWTL